MEKDAESSRPARIPWSTIVRDQGVVTPDIINHHYIGSGTEKDPFIVEWITDDPRNPIEFPQWLKWVLVQIVAIATLAVAFVSSAYSGGIPEIQVDFGSSREVNTLGISLFVLGFAIGPLIWAPLSELYGRQYLFTGTYAMLTIFNAGAAASQNIWTLVILRFFAGAFGSSPLTNAGGVIADMFPAAQRGLAMTVFAAAPFLGPVLGPIIGGFAGETIGWRWIEGIMALFTGTLWLIGSLFVPETYAPVLLRQRAKRLSKLSGKIYQSRIDSEQGKITAGHAFKTALSRPWILLFMEPIVLLLSIYMAIIYGTLYMLFGAFPIVFQESRGWSQGIGGLSFLGVMVGMFFAIAYALWDNKRYIRAGENEISGYASPEARLPVCMIGGIAAPIGLFWFSWTNEPSLPFMASIAAGVPFGFGTVLIFLGIMNYLIDAYTIFAASVLAANSVLRSLFGAIFPLFTSYMYAGLGIHWASSVPAFLALACVPFPFLFYRYGPAIRVRCKYAKEADDFLKKMRGELDDGVNVDESERTDLDGRGSSGFTARNGLASEGRDSTQHSTAEFSPSYSETEKRELEAFDYSYDDDNTHRSSANAGFQSIRPAGVSREPSAMRRTASGISLRSTRSGRYEGSPFDLDHVNTRDSFRTSRSRSASRSSVKSGGRRGII